MYLSSMPFLVAMFALCSATPTLEDPLAIGDPYSISPYEGNRDSFRNAGLVPGTRSCGGAGKVLRFRYEPCVTGSSPPCIIPHNGNYRGELVFIPSENADNVGIRVTVLTLDGNIKQYEHIVKDLNVVAGKEYALTNYVGATPELIGKQYIGQVEIFRERDRVVEGCIQADFFVV